MGLVQADFAPAEGVQQGVIKVNTVWGTSAVPQQDLDVCLALVDDQANTATTACQAPDKGGKRQAGWQMICGGAVIFCRFRAVSIRKSMIWN